MGADAAAPARVAALRQQYVRDYGFTSDLREGTDKTIWEPWRGVTVTDLDAVLSVAASLQAKPQHVLALWLQEGKHANDKLLHGKEITLHDVSPTVDVSMAQMRAWLRSWLLYQIFGTDVFTSFTAVPRSDNLLNDASADHNAAFVHGVSRLGAHNVPLPTGHTPESIRRYLTDSGGAMRASLTDAGGRPLPRTVPAGTPFTAAIALRQTALATLLYLQYGLFLTYEAELEALFLAEYGPPFSLSLVPWVTYIGWNGGITKQYKARFANLPTGLTPEERIAEILGDPPTKPLIAAELALYYKPEGSTSALGNAAQYKYLIEAVTPWFA